MKNLFVFYLILIFCLSSCGTRELFYPTKSRFLVFNESTDIDRSKTYYYSNVANYQTTFDTKNLFTLRIKEKQKYLKLKQKVVSEQPYRHFFADTSHALVDKDILEETYLYIDGLAENKSNGLVIFFNTFPVINSERDDNNYDDSKKIFLNYTKSMKTGLWLKQKNDLHILFNSGKDDVPIKAEIKWKKVNGKKSIKAVNFVEITHPQSIDKLSHKDRMKKLKETLLEYDLYKTNKSSNKFDIDLPQEFIDQLISDYLTSTALKMKNVFDVNDMKGLPFLVNSIERTPGIQHDTLFYQWTGFEVLDNHKIAFKTEKFSTAGMRTGIRKNFVYEEKYLNNLSPR